MYRLKYLMEKEGLLQSYSERVQEGIADFIDEAMNEAILENQFHLPQIHSFLSFTPDQIYAPGFPVITYMKDRAASFITSLLLSESVLIHDCEEKNLAGPANILLLYEDLRSGKKEKIDDEQVSSAKGMEYAFSAKLSLLQRYIKECQVDAASTTENKPGCSKAREGSLLAKVHRTFYGGFSADFFKNSLAFLPLQLQENETMLPVSFFPYIGTVTSWVSAEKEFMFNKTRKQMGKYKDTENVKDSVRNFGYLMKVHGRYKEDMDILCYAARSSRPAVLSANRFLFNQLLHQEFLGSLNCQLFHEITRRINLLYLRNMKEKAPSKSPFTYIEANEGLFYLRLMELLMLFDVGLKEIDDRKLYTDECTMTVADGTTHIFRTDFHSEKDALDSSIAFSYSMRFVYSFFENVCNGMFDLLSETLSLLKDECTDENRMDIMDEIALSESMKKKKDPGSFEGHYENNHILILTYLLNKGSLGMLFD